MGQWRLCKVPVSKLRLKGRITHAYFEEDIQLLLL